MSELKNPSDLTIEVKPTERYSVEAALIADIELHSKLMQEAIKQLRILRGDL